MSQAGTENDLQISHLEELFNRVQPRSRYISEAHVEDEISSISKEIVNGDISVHRIRGNVLPTIDSLTYLSIKIPSTKCSGASSSSSSARKKKN
jgi:hypothetical protein